MFTRFRWLAVPLILLASTGIGAQEVVNTPETQGAMSRLLKVIASRPFFALDWHDLKLAVVDEQSAARLKNALVRSGRSEAAVTEQILWVEAAAGRPQAALAFYDANILKRPEDKTLPNAACWARAAHGLDLQNVLAVCDAAVAAMRASHTLVHRGKAKLQLGLFSGALKDFNEALVDKKFRSHPLFADARFGRGIARARLGDADGKKDIRAAIRLDKRVVVNYADIGITY